MFRTLDLSVPHSVFGPQGLRLVRLTDISLLVEWEPVSGAEYYILTYHPKNDEHSLQQVAHTQMSNREKRKFESHRHFGLTKGSSSPQELLPHLWADSGGHLHCPGARRHQGSAQWSRHDWSNHRWVLTTSMRPLTWISMEIRNKLIISEEAFKCVWFRLKTRAH